MFFFRNKIIKLKNGGKRINAKDARLHAFISWQNSCEKTTQNAHKQTTRTGQQQQQQKKKNEKSRRMGVGSYMTNKQTNATVDDIVAC